MVGRRVLSMVGLALAIALVWTQAAQAYVIFGRWQGTSAALKADPSLPQSWYDAQRFAAQQWILVSPSPWRFTQSGSSQNQVSRGSIDGSLGVLATTTVYFNFGGDIVEADVEYDSAENWYTGPGTPGSNQVDLRSVGTHEFGHITGLDHTQNSHCPGNSTDATMCPFYTLGTNYTRTLEGDDRSGLNANYPGRDTSAQGEEVVVHHDYPALSDQDLSGLARIAFAGRVDSISPARWNSGAGTLASVRGATSARAYHEIRFRVFRSIRGGVSETVTLTVPGASPAGSIDHSLAGRPDHGLRVGQQVIVLATSAAMSWSDGTSRPVLRFVGAPSASYAPAGTERYGALLRLLG